jgi:hypothetical protein
MKTNLVKTSIMLALLALMLASCKATINDYQATTKPDFEMSEYFNGELRAYGIVQNRSGKVIRRFSADLTGSWESGSGTLDETFVYDDGETQQRIWNLEKLSSAQYKGVANDVVGTAYGNSNGFAFNWHYTLLITVDGKEWAVNLNDWIYQLDEKRIINRTVMKKWGIKVGEITLFIEKI